MLRDSKGAKSPPWRNLVAPLLQGHPGLVKSYEFPSRGHRAWFAWKCLPRDERGEPPTFRSLERAHGLANKDLSRLVWDFYKRPSYEKMQRFAAALKTTPEWLEHEEGVGPSAKGYVQPRPEPPAGMTRRTRSGQLRKVTQG